MAGCHCLWCTRFLFVNEIQDASGEVRHDSADGGGTVREEWIEGGEEVC